MTTQLEQQVGSLSLEFVEGLLADYLKNPDSVPPDWRTYFDDMVRDQGVGPNGGVKVEAGNDQKTGNGQKNGNGNSNGNGSGPGLGAAVTQIGPSFRPSSLFNPPRMNAPGAATTAPRIAAPTTPARTTTPQTSATAAADQWHMAVLQDRVDQIIRAYRVRGHLVAQLDPLGFPRPALPELEPAFYGFTEEDLNREFSTATIEGPQSMTLGRIIERMRNTYCRSIGVQFMHMDDLKVRQWLQERMEGTENRLHAQSQRAAPHSQRADQRHRVRRIHSAPLSRREKFFARRRRDTDSAVGHGDRTRRRAQSSKKSCWPWRIAAG